MALILLPPVMIIVLITMLIRQSDLRYGDLPGDYLVIIAAVILLSILTIALIKLIIRRQMSTEVDITSEGIHHLRPGRERMILWSDVKAVKTAQMGSRNARLRLILPKGGYTFDVYLVPDSPDAPQIVFKIGGPKWRLPDGTMLSFRIENSAGYLAVIEHRPDLL